MDRDTGLRHAVKLYVDHTYSEFIKEKMMNESLVNHPNVIIATKCVSYDETGASLFINSKVIAHYSYIVLPFYERGTLLDLIKKAYQPNSQGLSPDAVKHIWR